MLRTGPAQVLNNSFMILRLIYVNNGTFCARMDLYCKTNKLNLDYEKNSDPVAFWAQGSISWSGKTTWAHLPVAYCVCVCTSKMHWHFAWMYVCVRRTCLVLAEARRGNLSYKRLWATTWVPGIGPWAISVAIALCSFTYFHFSFFPQPQDSPYCFLKVNMKNSKLYKNSSKTLSLPTAQH